MSGGAGFLPTVLGKCWDLSFSAGMSRSFDSMTSSH